MGFTLTIRKEAKMKDKREKREEKEVKRTSASIVARRGITKLALKNVMAFCLSETLPTAGSSSASSSLDDITQDPDP